MRRIASSVLAGLAAVALLGACSSDSNPESVPTDADGSGSSETTTGSTGDSSSDTTAPGSTPAGDADCAVLKEAITGLSINWQIVMGLPNSPSSEWATLPIGGLPQMTSQISTLAGAMAGDAEATEALAFMQGAADIVDRGIGGDSAAQDELTTYLGDDLAGNLAKQIPIGTAYTNLGCA